MNSRQLRISFCLFLAILLTQGVSSAQSGGFDLDRILGVPFPSGMSAAPAGGAVAWIMNEKGARNVWVAESPAYRGRRLTANLDDDGLTISQLNWTPDGRSLVFVRGDGANRQGELPNPLHRPEGTERAIWLISLQDGTSRKLAQGSSPRVSRDGKGVAFTRRGQIWWIDFAETDAEGEKTKARHLVKARGGAGSLRWSPDGSRLAFVSNRGTHSFIGVYDWDKKSVNYLDPTVDRDSNPAWAPDSGSIAFRRTPAATAPVIFTPRREARPWSIHVADIRSGRTTRIWRAEEGPGSVYRGIVSSDQLHWSRDGFLVFAWEREGWTHLYSVPSGGGDAKLLTPGHFEVEQVAWASDRRHLVYSSNQGDIDRRHLWRVPAAGGVPQALTRGASNEWGAAPTSDGKAIALIRSTGKHPAEAAVLRRSRTEPRAMAPQTLPDDFPLDRLVDPQQVIFSGADGMKIHGQLFLPPGHRPGQRHPAMLYFHGGSRRQMLLGWHYSNYYHNCYALNQYLASQGYVVMSVNYRSGIGYGMEFREALNYGASGASEFNDVMGAGLYLQSRPDVDGERIGLWGGSYGGYLTALGLARASNLFAAGVDVHGVHDWNVTIKGFVPSYNILEQPQAARLAFESSPLAAIDTWRSPVLLIHGDDDRNVPFRESVKLAEELRKHDVEFEQLVFPDEVHGFLLYRSWLKAFRTASDFLERRLKRQPITVKENLPIKR